jgi:hypothetical protein
MSDSETLVMDTWPSVERDLFIDLMSSHATERPWQPTAEELLSIARKSAKDGFHCYAQQVLGLEGFMTVDEATEFYAALRSIEAPEFGKTRRRS